MQADEDVGKIALAVPVLVCKSCFYFLFYFYRRLQFEGTCGYLFIPFFLAKLFCPLITAKSLELFLQDLCDRTYEITLERGAKTVSSLHL